MTMIIELPPIVEEALASEARRRGTTPEQVATGDVLQKYHVARQDAGLNARLVALLDSFDESDPEVQQRELSDLKEALEEDRPGQRRLFSEGINP